MSILEDKLSFSIVSHDQTKECLFIWEEPIFTSLNKNQMEQLKKLMNDTYTKANTPNDGRSQKNKLEI